MSDSFIHNGAIVRLSASSRCVSHHGQLCQAFLLQLGVLLSVSFLGTILKLTSDVQDWIALRTLEGKNGDIYLNLSAVLIRF